MNESEVEELKRTSLHECHVELGAKMVSFAGWHMPVYYKSITSEHKAVRSAAGLFDVSHMGEIEISGPDALENVQQLVSNNVARLDIGGALYTGMLYPSGTFVDDLLVYKKAEDRYLLVVNAANTDKDFQWVKENIHGDANAENISDSICQLALQGPKSFDIFNQISSEPVQDLGSFTFLMGDVAGCHAMISRTGYTGEDGLEIYLDWDEGPKVWNAILETGKSVGIQSIGLGARDTLRLEAGLPLYGNDISDQTTPLEAGLKWTVKFKKGDFNGREVLLKQKKEGLQKKLVGFQMIDKGIPRPHYPVHSNGDLVSEVASGGLAIWLDKMIGTVYLPINLVEPGTIIDVEIRKRMAKAEVISLPFYKRE